MSLLQEEVEMQMPDSPEPIVQEVSARGRMSKISAYGLARTLAVAERIITERTTFFIFKGVFHVN